MSLLHRPPLAVVSGRYAQPDAPVNTWKARAGFPFRPGLLEQAGDISGFDVHIDIPE